MGLKLLCRIFFHRFNLVVHNQVFCSRCGLEAENVSAAIRRQHEAEIAAAKAVGATAFMTGGLAHRHPGMES